MFSQNKSKEMLSSLMHIAHAYCTMHIAHCKMEMQNAKRFLSSLRENKDNNYKLQYIMYNNL